MKTKIALSLALMTAFFLGCGSSDSKEAMNNDVSNIVGVYSGYAEDSAKNALSLNAYIVNNDTVILQEQNLNDTQTISAGIVNTNNITFGEHTCSVSENKMVCGAFTLAKEASVAFTPNNAIYAAVDTQNNVWNMQISGGSTVAITSATCSLSGELQSENEALAIVLHPSNCNGISDTALHGVVRAEKLYNENDTLNFLIPTQEMPLIWTVK